MGIIRETNPLQIRSSFGLALDEIKLKHSINRLTSLLDSVDEEARLYALRKEMSNKKKQLKSVQQLRL